MAHENLLRRRIPGAAVLELFGRLDCASSSYDCISKRCSAAFGDHCVLPGFDLKDRAADVFDFGGVVIAHHKPIRSAGNDRFDK